MSIMAPETEIYAVSDAKLVRMLTDTGSSTTYDTTLVDVPGIQSVTVTPNVTTKDNRGDMKLLDSKTVINFCEVKFNFSRWSADVWAILTGGTTVDAGTTPNRTKTFSWDYANGGYFKFIARVGGTDGDIEDMHVVLYKCNVTNPPDFNMADEDFAKFAVTARAYAPYSGNVPLKLNMFEAPTALTAAE